MKKFFLICLFALASIGVNAQVKWMTFNEAIEAQKKNKKPIFIDVYTVWCGPCKMLEKNTFSDSTISKILNEKYNPVKFNGEGNEIVEFKGNKFSNPNYSEARKNTRNSIHEFTNFLKLEAYPTMFVINSDGKVDKKIVGYYTAAELKSQL